MRRSAGIVLLCDLQGTLCRIVRDDLNLSRFFVLGRTFAELVDLDSFIKTLNFLETLREHGTVFGWEINLAVGSSTRLLNFGGMATEQALIIIGANSQTDTMKIRQELVKDQKSPTKPEESQHPEGAERDDFYDELSRLNNELTTLQREMTKKNLELQEKNRELENFTHMVSHDLLAPLHVIRGYAQLLWDRYGEGEVSQVREMLTPILDTSLKAATLLQDLLAFSQAGHTPLNFKTVDMSEVLKTVLMNLSDAIKESRAVVHYGPLPRVQGDESLLIVLMQNLLSNALKFRGQEPPRIDITASRRSDEVGFSVKDNGIGISHENEHTIFDSFKRLHKQTEYPGSGIGLATCKKIVERHGGRIWVESQTGRGATFCFTLFPETPDQ